MLGRELMRWNPFEEFPSWHRNNDLFDRFFGCHELPVSRWMPPVEAYRKDDDYVVRLDLPGVDTKDAAKR